MFCWIYWTNSCKCSRYRTRQFRWLLNAWAEFQAVMTEMWLWTEPVSFSSEQSKLCRFWTWTWHLQISTQPLNKDWPLRRMFLRHWNRFLGNLSESMEKRSGCTMKMLWASLHTRISTLLHICSFWVLPTPRTLTNCPRKMTIWGESTICCPRAKLSISVLQSWRSIWMLILCLFPLNTSQAGAISLSLLIWLWALWRLVGWGKLPPRDKYARKGVRTPGVRLMRLLQVNPQFRTKSIDWKWDLMKVQIVLMTDLLFLLLRQQRMQLRSNRIVERKEHWKLREELMKWEAD